MTDATIIREREAASVLSSHVGQDWRLGDEARVLELTGADIAYPGQPPFLRNVTLALDRACSHYVAGPRNSGKSTLLRALAQRWSMPRGAYFLFGARANALSRRQKQLFRRRMVHIRTEDAWIPHLNLFDNVALPLNLRGEKRRDYASDVSDLLRWIGLWAHAAELPAGLSKSQQRAASLARALIARPDLVLADEPFRDVEESLKPRLARLFAQLQKNGTSFLWVCEDPQLREACPGPVLTLGG